MLIVKDNDPEPFITFTNHQNSDSTVDYAYDSQTILTHIW